MAGFEVEKGRMTPPRGSLHMLAVDGLVGRRLDVIWNSSFGIWMDVSIAAPVVGLESVLGLVGWGWLGKVG